MEESYRSGAMDAAVSIPAAPLETFSDDRIAIFMSPMPQKSPSIKIHPLGLHNETIQPAPSFARSTVISHIKKVAAELLGTFLLVFLVTSALIANEMHGDALGPVGEAVASGLAMVVTVAPLVHVSGGHLNPAVSLAMAVFGHLPRAHLAPYVAAQLVGAVAASFAARAVHGAANSGAAVIATVPTVGAAEAFGVEFVATFVLVFVITALATDPKAAAKELVAVGAGAAVTTNSLIFGEWTGASMNPARTLGTAIATGTYTKIWVYMVAPPLGAIAGAGAYTALKLN
ncbi:aquaporin NIP3-3-like [Oryza brachyantha]|uniref:Uncharacterized protein n=1 Tax=Oryza brachyantha TaxID=4533 RepID=J3MQD7_ORYBR|nr:aquaporin NIP3-3-like [Oryza brachyantha]